MVWSGGGPRNRAHSTFPFHFDFVDWYQFFKHGPPGPDSASIRPQTGHILQIVAIYANVNRTRQFSQIGSLFRPVSRLCPLSPSISSTPICLPSVSSTQQLIFAPIHSPRHSPNTAHTPPPFPFSSGHGRRLCHQAPSYRH